MYYKLLIKFNSDINDLNFDEQTPLEVAILN
jgi:ankyrin repeat protein